MQWYKSQSEDKCLMECLEIVQQLSGTKDVTRDLQYIIDMKAKYRQWPHKYFVYNFFHFIKGFLSNFL